MALTGLLMLTKGLENSGYFDVPGARLVQRFQHECALAMFMVCAAALLSILLTDDVALFILVPLTLTLRKFSQLPISRLIIFEALAVNAGSLLTPVGNPQNILIWSHGSLSVAGFILQMAPLAAVLMVSLMVPTWLCFPAHSIQKHAQSAAQQWRKSLFFISMLLYILFVVALELKMTGWALIVVAVCFLLMARSVLLSIDWSLLLVFVVMFIDVFLLMHLPQLQPRFATMRSVNGGRAVYTCWRWVYRKSSVMCRRPFCCCRKSPLPKCWRGRSISVALACCRDRWLT